MRIGSNIGILLLAIYLILTGIMAFAPLGLSAGFFGVLAIVTGIFLLIGR